MRFANKMSESRVNQLLQKDYIGVREMQFCSQIVRKTKKKELHF